MSVSFNANDRASLAFSAKRDVMRGSRKQAPAVSVSQAAPKFGRLAPYSGQFDTVHVATDFNDDSSNNRVYQRFQVVEQFLEKHPPGFWHFAKEFLFNRQGLKIDRELKAFAREGRSLLPKTGVLDHTNISDIPARNVDYAAQTLSELGRETNHDIFIHVTDPGVGSGHKGHERSILVTPKNGVYIGPNNGSLGLLAQYLERKAGSQTKEKAPYKLLEIDLDKVNHLEAIRTGNPNATSGSTFHGRDVFAVAAAFIAAGGKPESLAKAKPIKPVVSPYGRLAKLPQHVGESTRVYANVDNTAGNLVLNLPLSLEAFNEMRESNSRFSLSTDAGESVELPVKRTFAEVKLGEPLLYLGSKLAPEDGKKFVEVALNRGDIGKKLKLDSSEAAPQLTLKKLS